MHGKNTYIFVKNLSGHFTCEKLFRLFLFKFFIMSLEEEIKRRRTFGIISHPDAGKTTLTEKLLLFGGAINEAGAVKSNKIKPAEIMRV